MDTTGERITALILNTGGSTEVVAGILAIVAEDREKLVTMIRQAHDACYSEYMDCPWCSGHVGVMGNEWHDDTCEYAALSSVGK